MPSKILLFIYVFSFAFLSADAQDYFNSNREMYVSFQNNSDYDLDKLSSLFSIDRIEEDGTIKAYLNEHTFKEFDKLNINYSILPPPAKSLKTIRMLHNPELRDPDDWNFYPDYPSYLEMMHAFQENYPELCQVFSIGQSIEGRDILMARISSNILENEGGKAKVLYTSSMHGNELAGFNLSLRLIDHLLNEYGNETEITSLLEDLDIWINPLANPDGAYAGGNQSVSGAKRSNANGVDLNRNFPDPEDGIHPDGKDWQKETKLFMKLAEENHFVLAANFHAGAELINYPWDTWQELPVDDKWWYFIGREWADTIHQYAPPDYFDAFHNGVTNGYTWYSISGGRQDYMNYFHGCREFTLEITDATLLAPDLLDIHWEYQYRSMINYLKQATFGLQGRITDNVSQEPIRAKINIPGHDDNSSSIFSDEKTGLYYRPIYEGNYTMEITSPCYEKIILEDVSVTNHQSSIHDFEMLSSGLNAAFESEQTAINPGEKILFSDKSCGYPSGWSWSFEGGIPQNSDQQVPGEIHYPNIGIFNVSLQVDTGDELHTEIKEELIIVAPQFAMQDTISHECFAYFMDSGEDDTFYNNNEQATITFYPDSSFKKIAVDFLSFNLEDEVDCKYDWLKIYDGPTTDSPLLGVYCGKDSPGLIQSTHASGALCFEFHSDQSVTHPGWTALINCEDLTNTHSAIKDDFIMYPNPGSNKINIRGSQIIKQIRVIDLSGNTRQQFNFNSKHIILPTDNLPEGIYIIQVISSKGIVAKKLSVN